MSDGELSSASALIDAMSIAMDAEIEGRHDDAARIRAQGGAILSCDPGLANGGWAIVTPKGRVVDLGVVVTKPDGDAAKAIDRCQRLREHVDVLRGLVTRYGVTTIAAEAVSLPPRAQIATVASAYLAWGMLVTLAATSGSTLLEVKPKQWQRAIVPGHVGAVDYTELFVLLSAFVDEGPARTKLLEITKSRREHALDAVGVGVYAALTPTATVVCGGVA